MILGKQLPFLVIWGDKKGPRKHGIKYELLVRFVKGTKSTLFNVPIIINECFEKEMDKFIEELNMENMQDAIENIDKFEY